MFGAKILHQNNQRKIFPEHLFVEEKSRSKSKLKMDMWNFICNILRINITQTKMQEVKWNISSSFFCYSPLWAEWLEPNWAAPLFAPHTERPADVLALAENPLWLWHPINNKPRESCVNCYHVFGPGIPINHRANCNKLWSDIKLWFRTGEYSSTLQLPP